MNAHLKHTKSTLARSLQKAEDRTLFIRAPSNDASLGAMQQFARATGDNLRGETRAGLPRDFTALGRPSYLRGKQRR